MLTSRARVIELVPTPQRRFKQREVVASITEAKGRLSSEHLSRLRSGPSFGSREPGILLRNLEPGWKRDEDPTPALRASKRRASSPPMDSLRAKFPRGNHTAGQWDDGSRSDISVRLPLVEHEDFPGLGVGDLRDFNFDSDLNGFDFDFDEEAPEVQKKVPRVQEEAPSAQYSPDYGRRVNNETNSGSVDSGPRRWDKRTSPNSLPPSSENALSRLSRSSVVRALACPPAAGIYMHYTISQDTSTAAGARNKLLAVQDRRLILPAKARGAANAPLRRRLP